jgi:nucleoid-associated protein Lsr2
VAEICEVRLVDRRSGWPDADETVEFGIDGKNHEIYLSTANAGRLRDALADCVSAARRSGGGRRRSAGTGSASGAAEAAPKGRALADREQNEAIRDWARKRGMKVSNRRRISSEVVEAYTMRCNTVAAVT